MDINVESHERQYTITVQVRESEAYAIMTFLSGLSQAAVERVVSENAVRSICTDAGISELTRQAYFFTSTLYSELYARLRNLLF